MKNFIMYQSPGSDGTTWPERGGAIVSDTLENPALVYSTKAHFYLSTSN
jgi:hypothetical protein